MSDVFISYARSTASQAAQVAEALRALGYGVWLDDELPAHRSYSDVIEERLKAARAVVVIWSAEAVKSQWVRAEATAALEAGTLVQLCIDGAIPPLPFNQIQCADLNGWSGDLQSPGWRKVVASIGELMGGGAAVRVTPPEPPPPLPTKPSIAVLPFANLSGDPEQDYFADGMVEEIAGALSRFKSLFVISGGSGLSFKGKATSPQEAARILGVRYVLEGSVRKAGIRVRIAVKLIDAADAAQIWSDRFEDTLDDIFALQDKVAVSVAAVIAPAVREAEFQRASARPTQNMGSYDLCLRGQSLYRSVAKSDVLAGLDLLDAAIALDPDYAWAMALAATCHAFIIFYGWSDDLDTHVAEARDLIKRAIAVASADPDALAYVANAILMIGGDLDTAAPLADQAAQLNPGSSFVWGSSGWVRLCSGETDLAVSHFETAMRLNPLSPERSFYVSGLALARFAQGRYREAIPLLRQSLQLRPEWPLNHVFLAASHGHLGETSAGREWMARYGKVTSVDVRTLLRNWTIPPSFRTSFLEGIALAEGGAPPQSPAEPSAS
ncbi:MAG TPA: TIR domain-containing protein [Caulobacteraceae bacterium]